MPLLTVSAKTGKGLDQLLGAAFEVRETWSKRVSTGQLNRWFEEAVEKNPPPAPSGRRIKLRYITQVGARPPSFVVFGSRLEALPESYLPLSDERHAPRARLRRGAGPPARFAARKNPLRPRKPDSPKLSRRQRVLYSPASSAGGVDEWTGERAKRSSTGRSSVRRAASWARDSCASSAISARMARKRWAGSRRRCTPATPPAWCFPPTR